MIQIVPISLRDAHEVVRRLHRHHKPSRGGKFAIGLADDDTIRGVAIVGRPVARLADDGFTAEVTRLATDGIKNGCSLLYAACWRAARAMGYRKLITYILSSEAGTSVTAAGWKRIGECGGGSWNRNSRPRVDQHPTQQKIRFEVTA